MLKALIDSYHAYPTSGKRFYMRTLLSFVKCPTCYEPKQSLKNQK